MNTESESFQSVDDVALINSLLENLAKELTTKFAQLHQGWINSNFQALEILEKHLEALRSQLLNQKQSVLEAGQVFAHSTRYLKSLQDDLNLLFNLIHLPAEEVISSFDSILTKSLSSLPEKIELKLPFDEWLEYASKVEIEKRHIEKWKQREERRLKFNELKRKVLSKSEPPPENHYFLKTFELRSLINGFFGRHLLKSTHEAINLVEQTVGSHIVQVQEAINGLNREFLVNSITQAELQKDMKWETDSLAHWFEKVDGLLRASRDALDAVSVEISETSTIIDERKNFAIRYFPFVGTSAIAKTQWDSDSSTNSRNSLIQTMKSLDNQWQEYFTGRKEDWKKDIELRVLQIQHAATLYRAVQEIRVHFSDVLDARITRTREVIEKNFITLSEEKTDDKKRISDAFKTIELELLRELRHRIMPNLINAVVRSQIDSSIRGYGEGSANAVDKLPELLGLYREKAQTVLPPVVELEFFEFREVIQDEMLTQLVRHLEELIGKNEVRQGKFVRQISDLDQILEVNLNAGKGLLEKSEEQDSLNTAYAVVEQGFERLLTKMDSLLAESSEIRQYIITELWEHGRNFELRIDILSSDEEVINLKVRRAKAAAKEQLRLHRQTLLRNLGNSFKYIAARLPRLFLWGQREYSRLRRMTGLVDAEGSVNAQLLVFLREADRRISNLPFVYQQLFKLTPLSDSRFFTGREIEIAELTTQFELWKQGHLTSVGLVGEQGSGRTSLLNIAEEKVFRGVEVKKITLTETILEETAISQIFSKSLFDSSNETLESLKERIQSEDLRFVVIVENLHQLFLRTTDGFNSLEKFLALVASTSDHIFWVLSCNQYSWQLMDRVVKVSRYVQQTIQMRSLSEEKLQNIIMKRHAVSGFGVEFEISDAVRRSQRYKKRQSDSKKQEVAENVYFERLKEVAGGNIASAMIMFLISIKEVQKNKFIMKSRVEVDDRFLIDVIDEEMFVLGSIVQHGGMKADEVAKVLKISLTTSQN
ncbi:ATP-binding protein, partial [bacterium]|nr:ATP-binding protein [bacterium]